jgi:uncharacterized protein (DUF1499 family)
MAQLFGRLTLALGLMIAGCSMSDEITPPAPGNISEFHRPISPNSYLAAPATFILPPDVKTHLYSIAPDRLFATVREVIMAQPRTTALAVDADRLRADQVVRSRVFRFPDIVLAQVLRTPGGSSELVLYSYSLKGYYDFGVNGDRVRTLLSALDAALGQSS